MLVPLSLPPLLLLPSGEEEEKVSITSLDTDGGASGVSSIAMVGGGSKIEWKVKKVGSQVGRY